MARCDLHVHTWHSGPTDHVTLLEPMDSYSTPGRLYRRAKARGMDFVTITDHNSIGGCQEFLQRHPECTDFFISEEVTVPLPRFGYNLHLGIYDITEEDHDRIQELRTDLDALLEYVGERGIFHVWNHPFFQFPRGEAGARLLAHLAGRFQAFEAINSSLPPEMNEACLGCLNLLETPGRVRPILVAGSDSHGLARVGSSWTEAPGRTVTEFIANLRAGNTILHGNHGKPIGVFGDAMSVYLGYERDLLWRNEVHRVWSTWKKCRNTVGWALWLPVFTVGALCFSFLQFHRFRRWTPAWADIFRRAWSPSPVPTMEQ